MPFTSMKYLDCIWKGGGGEENSMPHHFVQQVEIGAIMMN
jgi:hypothetical protein